MSGYFKKIFEWFGNPCFSESGTLSADINQSQWIPGSELMGACSKNTPKWTKCPQV